MKTQAIGPDGNQELERVKDEPAPTLTVVRAHLSLYEPKIDIRRDGWWSIELPRPLSANYQFSLHGGWGERQISAQPIGINAVNPRSFWYSAFELAAFRHNPSKLEQSFHDRVKALMLCATRIVENKGVFLLGYRGQYQAEEGWLQLGGVSYFGLGFGIPFFGKKRVFSSPPVISFNQS